MTYKELRLKLKEEQKALVALHTEKKRNGYSSLYREVRTKHIAQSLFRGKPFESIEYKWKDEKNPEHAYIKKNAEALYEQYKAMVTAPPPEPAQESTNV